VATRSQHYTSEVAVYPDLDGEVRFRWYPAEKMVSALALSSDAQLLAVGGTTSKAGARLHALSLFGFAAE
jgi:hypothetical protein